MSLKCQTIATCDFSLWFALLSPLLGVLVGLLGIFLLNP